jgi:hypothetical protein
VPNHFSPERIKAWKDDYQDVEFDLIYKSDVYSLGLVILQAGKLDLKSQHSYNFKESLQEFRNVYSEKLTQIVWKMINPDHHKRPDFLKLLEMLEYEGLMQQRL